MCAAFSVDNGRNHPQLYTMMDDIGVGWKGTGLRLDLELEDVPTAGLYTMPISERSVALAVCLCSLVALVTRLPTHYDFRVY